MTPIIAISERTDIQTEAAMSRGRWSAQQKTVLLARFAQSGLTAARFCRENGLHAATFSQWRRRQSLQPGQEAAVGFAQVRVVAPASGGEPVLVELGGAVRLSVPVGTDASWLAALLCALRSAGRQ